MSNSNLFIVLKEHDKNYKTISTYCCEDTKLSWKAKGLWMYLITRPPNWIIRLQDLKNRSKNGSDSLSSGMKELIDNKYVFRILKKNSKQQIESYGYLVFEIPQDNLNQLKINKICPGWQSDMKNPGNPVAGNPVAGNPVAGNLDYNNKNINKVSLYKYKETKEASPLDVETDNIPNNENLPNKDFEPILSKIEQQVETLLQKNNDIQKIIDYWNNLPKPLSDHKDKNTKTYLSICQNLEKLLKKNYADKIINSIQIYFDLITFPYFKLSPNIPGVVVSLDNFIKVNGYLKTKIKDSDLLISWFEKCSVKTLEQLKEKYSKESKDLYPDITSALKDQWLSQINDNKIFSVAEENYLKKAAVATYNYFKNVKDFRFDSYYRREYPATCAKLVIKALLKNHPDIEMVPGWLWSDNFFKNILETYLRKNTYIVDGHDTPRSNGSWQPLSDPEDLEYVRKQNEEKERETRNSCLTEDDFL